MLSNVAKLFGSQQLSMDDLNSYSMFEYVSSRKIILDEHSSLGVVLRISLWPMKP